MEDRKEERRLTPSLAARIDGLDKARPYVWRLKLTEADFREMEAAISESISAHGGDNKHLLSRTWAMTSVTYLAEWYKRKYQSGETACELHFTTDELKELWAASGMNQQVLVYKDDAGNSRWLYSIYVLGGLAVSHEISRPDSNRFLKGLCRIYHGEEYTLENLDDVQRAASFRESIRRKHSLYEYMLELLSGNLPFAEEDLKDAGNEISRFVAAMKSANDEVLRQKFRFEWIVSCHPKDGALRRMMRLWLCPEEVGGGLHQYLRYDRVHLWGIPQPEKQESLRVAIGFYDGDTAILAPDWENPLITYSNTGSSETGFLSWGVERSVLLRNVPSDPFSEVKILIRTDDENVYEAGNTSASSYLQLWQTDSGLWSSKPDHQRATALLFSSDCHLKAGSSQIHLATSCGKENSSEEWGWAYIYDSIILVDSEGKEHIFYNRNGYDQVTTVLYGQAISYIEGGFVKHCYSDDEGYDEELLPLIFSRNDVVTRHFETKDAITDVRLSEEKVAESIEWKQANGHYTAWTEDSLPPFGITRLRISVKGQTFPLTAAYLPSCGAQPIIRDCTAHKILYKNILEETCTFEDSIIQDGNPLDATSLLVVGTEDDYFEIPVFRPTLQKEVCIEDKVVAYREGEVVLPYILKQEVLIRDFSKDGFREYQCGRLSGLWKRFIKISAEDFWMLGYCLPAKELDADAPECLKLALGDAPEDRIPETLTILQWDYDKETEPSEADYSAAPANNTVTFQSMEMITPELHCLPAKRKFSPFTYKSKVVPKMSLLSCFETAIKHRLYFFIFEPMAMTKKQEKPEIWKIDIYLPLMEKYYNRLDERTVLGLLRLAEEMDFDWKTLGVTL